MFTVNEEEGVSINIDYIPEDLACILQIENKGNYSSSLRFIEEDYHNFDAYVFERNSYHSQFEPRGHFSFSNSTTPTQNDFHIWYDNTSFIILTVKDPNQGPGHFRSTAVPLPAPEEDIEHIRKHNRIILMQGLFFLASVVGCVFCCLFCFSVKRDAFRLAPVVHHELGAHDAERYMVDSQQLLQKEDIQSKNPNLFCTNELGEVGYRMVQAPY
eukprot:CAMPEP_0196999108 /NCGR_PEP_ID=MMETSP1380-20130617/4354_1 /TAXON_ID=5936 /ORGANISM="Euplotes crassus, Strain CT5" /LENGTH=213 /DNA_ID=CAMNT_0042415923 /DNA_START=275 /DNA_END=916 /DNA_ORIENTATION=-